MNVPVEIAGRVLDNLKAKPFVMVLLIINAIAFGGFAYSMHEISKAADRRDALLEKCMDK
jgi:hypothetical protein